MAVTDLTEFPPHRVTQEFDETGGSNSVNIGREVARSYSSLAQTGHGGNSTQSLRLVTLSSQMDYVATLGCNYTHNWVKWAATVETFAGCGHQKIPLICDEGDRKSGGHRTRAGKGTQAASWPVTRLTINVLGETVV